MKSNGIIEDSEIENAFQGTRYGTRDRRKLLEQGVLKNLAGYVTGHTLKCIMENLGLRTKKGTITKHGKKFVYEAFKDSKNSG